jgi:hypothetical protein
LVVVLHVLRDLDAGRGDVALVLWRVVVRLGIAELVVGDQVTLRVLV